MRQWGGGWIPAWDEAAEKEDSSVILEHCGSAQIIWPVSIAAAGQEEFVPLPAGLVKQTCSWKQ